MKRPIIIAEAGNNHEGNFNKAIELIEKANEAGADLVKFQAGTAEGFARSKEDISRYKKYCLPQHDCLDLIEHGKNIGIDVFFSIFGDGFELLRQAQKWQKIPARQCFFFNIELHDSPNTFISIPQYVQLNEIKNLRIKYGVPLHCINQYPSHDPKLWRIKLLREILQKPCGYSDHSIGIQNCVKAVQVFKACAIEKHFTLDKRTKGLRDHILSADFDDLRKLVEAVKC